METSSVYLDYNAATPPDASVIEAIKNSLEVTWGNPSSSYSLGRAAKEAIESSREKVARMINADKSDEIFFMSGGTEANNLVLNSVVCSAKKVSGVKPHIITTNVEHDSVLMYLKHLQYSEKIDVSFAEVDKTTGSVYPEVVLTKIRPQTCLITIMHANNETGVIMPIEEITRALTKINGSRSKEGLKKILFHTDAAQTIGKIKVDVKDLGVDYLTIVGSKYYGPRIGALYVKDNNKTPIIPMLFGGGQEHGLRSGTENTPMIVGLGQASELVTKNLEQYKKDMKNSRDYLARKVSENGIEINFSQAIQIPNTLSVKVPSNMTARCVLERCFGQLYVSMGAACHSGSGKPSNILIASGLSPDEATRTLRFSVGRMTSVKDLDFAVKVLEKACKVELSRKLN